MYTKLTAVTSLTTCLYVRHAALSDVCVQQQQKQHMARAAADTPRCTVLVRGCGCPSTIYVRSSIPCGTARKRAEESTNTNRIKMPPSRYVVMLLHIAFPLPLLFLLQQHTHKQYDPFIIHGWHARATAIKHGAHKTGIKS